MVNENPVQGLVSWSAAMIVLLILGFDDWVAKGGFWHFLMMTALSFVALHTIAAAALRWQSWLQPSAIWWIERKYHSLRWVGLVSSGVAVLLIVDLLSARWLFTPSMLETPVLRTLCNGTGLRSDLPVHQGKVCFVALVGADGNRFNSRLVWRVDQHKLEGDIPVGTTASIRERKVNQAWLPLGGYTQIVTIQSNRMSGFTD